MRSVLIAAIVSTVAAAGVVPQGCSGTPNNQPFYVNEPTLVQTVPNGAKYVVGPNDANYTNPTTVVHMFGDTQYQMGYAYGQMLKAEINTMVPLVYQYLEKTVNASLPKMLPPFLRNAIAIYGVEYALELTYNVTKPFTPAHHYETLQGMSDGSGVPYQKLSLLSMIPELIKASCSMLGAWGNATAQTDSKLVQLRALDWETTGPFQQFPVLAVWHPAAGNGNTFATLGWAGMLGAVTGISTTGMGISEKLWDQYTGTENIFGYVWNFMLQDILQFDIDSDQALSRIATANRTCSFWIGLGDEYNNQFKIIGYSNQEVIIYNDRNFPSGLVNHDKFTNMLFLDKHVQWSGNPCMNELMHAYYGDMSPVNVARNVVPVAQTGDMHAAVFDYENGYMYFSNAGLVNAAGQAVPSYDRPFIRVDLNALWAVPNPSAKA